VPSLAVTVWSVFVHASRDAEEAASAEFAKHTMSAQTAARMRPRPIGIKA
jgi:hypothetical protein